MADYTHYCERCGKEDGGDAVRCDDCGVQMCGSCASGAEIETEVCRRCRRASDEQERLEELRAFRPRVLHCMRRWYDRELLKDA